MIDDPAPVLSLEAGVRDTSEPKRLTARRRRLREMYEGHVDAHYGSVYRSMLFLTGDANLAEDLTQEVFASAWGALARFRGQASVRTWLHRIGYHVFIDVQRRRARDQALADRLTHRRSEGPADPMSRVLADEHLAQVYQALESLEVGERAVLILHYIEGLSYRQMARVLGRPNGTLKWLTNRALENLRRQLAGKVEP